MTSHRPPRAAAWIVEHAATAEDRASLLSDLAQEFQDIVTTHGRRRAVRWYWRQAIGSVVPLIKRRGDIAMNRAVPSPVRTRSMPVLSGITADARFAWRLARRAPIATMSIVVAVALGIAATTSIVSVMEGVFLRPLPFPSAEALVRLSTSIARFGQAPEVNFLDARDLGAMTKSFSAVATYEAGDGTIRLSPGEPAMSGTLVSAGPGLAELLGIQPAAGRFFTPDEQVYGGPLVALITERFWRRYYASDPSVIGRSIIVGTTSRRIVGVLPEAANRFPAGGSDVWDPLTFPATSFLNQRGSIALSAIGRLQNGVSIADANAELGTVGAALAAAYPETNRTRRFSVDGLQDAMVGPVRPMMIILSGALGLLLMVACANIANLLLAQTDARRRELGVRLTLGATSRRLARQMWVECLMLFGVAGAIGVAMALPMARAVVAAYPGALPLAADVVIDARVLAAASLITLAAMLVAGLPRSRGLGTHAFAALQGAGRGAVTRRHRRIARLSVGIQVGVSIVLVFGGLLLLRTFMNIVSTNPGFDARDIVTIRASLPIEARRSPETLVAFQEELRQAAASVPGVQSAAHAMFIPFDAGTWGDGFRRVGVDDARQTGPAGPFAHFYMVSPEYLQVLGLPILSGRGLTHDDRASTAKVLVVSEAFARMAYPGESALGKRIAWNDDVWEIVGVTSDIRHASLWDAVDADAYVPSTQVPRGNTWLVLKTTRPAGAIAAELNERMRIRAPTLALTGAKTMSARIGDSAAPERFRALVTGTVAALSLVLALIGLYGVVSYAVSQRRREIGVRLALGERAEAVRRGVVLGVWGHILTGAVPGAAVSIWLSRWLAAQGVIRASPSWTLATVVFVFFAAATIAAAAPAWRASRVDPIEALRAE